MIDIFRRWLIGRKAARHARNAQAKRRRGVREPLQFDTPPKDRQTSGRNGASAENLTHNETISFDEHRETIMRNKIVREDTGTHEKLVILDESMLDSGEETGIDPYNTGGFDRSKNWDTRFRK